MRTDRIQTGTKDLLRTQRKDTYRMVEVLEVKEDPTFLTQLQTHQDAERQVLTNYTSPIIQVNREIDPYLRSMFLQEHQVEDR